MAAFRQKNKRFWVAVVVVLVIVIVVAAAIAISFGVLTSKDNSKKADSQKDASKSERDFQKVYLLSKVSNREYSAAMADPSSSEFNQFAAEFCQEIEGRLDPYYTYFRGCVVNELRNGSVDVNYTIVVDIDVTNQSLSTLLANAEPVSSVFQIASFLLQTSSTGSDDPGIMTTVDDNPVAKSTTSFALPTPTAVPKPCSCTREYRPVCGVDGDTYGNRCVLDCAKIGWSHDGACPPVCPCPRILRPVCGQDGKTYNNACLMECAGAALLHRGKCRAETTTAAPTTTVKNVPCICKFIYAPVCGNDGVTYGNKCNLDCKKGVTKVSDGPC